MQLQPRQSKHKHVDPMKAKVYVAGHSVRTIQQYIQAAALTRVSNVQVCSKHNFCQVFFFKFLHTFKSQVIFSLVLCGYKWYVHHFCVHNIN